MTGDNNNTPNWPEDLLYVPVNPPSHDRPKGPDAPTWGADGTGCTPHPDLHDRRWGIVDVDSDDHRLLAIDLDHHKEDELDDATISNILEGLVAAPNTRTHTSQSGGTHVFYWVREDELDYDEANDRHVLPDSFIEGIDDRLNGYVLSTHCDGYAVENDTEPIEITLDQLPDVWFKDEDDADGGGWDDLPDDGIGSGKDANVYDILSESRFPENERVAHPEHGSSTGANFMVDEGGDTWRCWRHQCTGDAIHLLGIKEGIISCGEWVNGLPTETERRLLEAAEDAGLIEKTRPSQEERKEQIQEIEERHAYDSIEEAEFPDSENFVLDKPPREGGSHWAMQNFIEKPEDLLILGPRHAILAQHLETLEDILHDTELAAVHFEGKHRVCEHPDAEQCPNAPEGYAGAMRLEDTVRDTLYRKKTVNADDAPEGTCPAAFIREAMRQANVVATVSQLFTSVVDERDTSQMRLLIDEEQSISNFWPGSVDLTDIVLSYETDGTISIEQREQTIADQEDVLHRIQEQIEDEQDERREGEGRFRRNSYEITLQQCIDTYDEIMDLLGTTDVVTELIDNNEKVNLGNAINNLEDRLDDVDLPEVNTDADTIYDRINEYSAQYYWRDDVDPSSFLTALAFAYDEQPFDFKRTGRARHTLRLIGDREQEPFYADEFAEFQQIGVIAGPEGERFLDDIDGDARTINIDSFRYADDYCVVPLAQERDEDETEPAHSQRARVKRVSQKLNRRNTPNISVVGTKERATELSNQLTAGNSTIVGDPESPASALYSLWTEGSTAIIYENSVVSRGIDAPFFDITVLCEPGFAVPYWEAKATRYKGDDADEYMSAISRVRELKARELTNAALRTAPTRGTEQYMGTKFIIVSNFDADDLLYLQDRRLDRLEDEDAVANAIDTMTIGGGLATTKKLVMRELGGSEKEFVETALAEEFTETIRDRPAYALGDISTWIGEGHISDDNEIHYDVIDTIRELGEPTTVEVQKSAPIRDRAAVGTMLKILHRKGVADHCKENDGTRGPPTKRWTVD